MLCHFTVYCISYHILLSMLYFALFDRHCDITQRSASTWRGTYINSHSSLPRSIRWCFNDLALICGFSIYSRLGSDILLLNTPKFLQTMLIMVRYHRYVHILWFLSWKCISVYTAIMVIQTLLPLDIPAVPRPSGASSSLQRLGRKRSRGALTVRGGAPGRSRHRPRMIGNSVDELPKRWWIRVLLDGWVIFYVLSKGNG